MFKWIAAAIAVLVVSVAISIAHMNWSSAPHAPMSQAAFERAREIELQYEPVSLVRLLAAPERYEGRKVRVEGFVTLGSEDAGIHLDKAAYLSGLRRNALWLDPAWLKPETARRLNRRYAEVAGTFTSTELGHMGLYSGALRDVQRIEPALTDTDFRRYMREQRHSALMQRLLSGPTLTLAGWTGLFIFWLLWRARSR